MPLYISLLVIGLGLLADYKIRKLHQQLDKAKKEQSLFDEEAPLSPLEALWQPDGDLGPAMVAFLEEDVFVASRAPASEDGKVNPADLEFFIAPDGAGNPCIIVATNATIGLKSLDSLADQVARINGKKLILALDKDLGMRVIVRSNDPSIVNFHTIDAETLAKARQVIVEVDAQQQA